MHVITTYRGAYKVSRTVRAVRETAADADRVLPLLRRIEPEMSHRVGMA